MAGSAITRRSFLAASAGVAAVAAGAGYLSFSAWDEAQAAGQGEQKAVHSLCNSCSSKCGYTAYVGADNSLTTMVGDKEHPYCDGTLCARGYGYVSATFSEDRLTTPLKRNANGEYESISWDDAYREIGEQVQSIIASDGPQALVMIQDPRPSGSYYTKRFMQSLGSANTYTHGVSCNMSKTGGFTQALGVGDYTSDVANANMVMFIGRSYADGMRPASMHALRDGRANGARIVMVDPRYNASAQYADEWVPITPGTDLALVLGMAHVLVTNGTYDKEYVENYTVGFEDWAERLKEYTPAWASELTGIPAETIERLANEMWEAAPKSSIEQSWRAVTGCSYQNSGETARAIALFNTLLGCWGVEGGTVFHPSVSAGKLDDPRFAAPPTPTEKIIGAEEFPVSTSSMGVSTFALSQIPEGRVKGVFFYQSNCVGGYSNPAKLAEFVEQAQLSVAIDVQMTETCHACQYVLPDTTYLERVEVPEFVGGKIPYVGLRDKVFEKLHPETRPVDQIFCELAEACGAGEYFQFTVEELADAQLKSVGLSLDKIREMGGFATFPEKQTDPALKTTWGTPSKKVQFTSEACEKAGFPASPGWLDPLVTPKGDELRLIGGKQSIHTHTQTMNVDLLVGISKEFGLDRVWLNAQEAEKRGIKDNDEIEISSNEFTGRTRVKVTERLAPGCLFLPSHYGRNVPEQRLSMGVGLSQMDFVSFHIEPGYGGTMSQEVVVTVKKVGA